MSSTTAQKVISTAILATQQRTSKRGNTYYLATLEGIAQPVTLFAEDAAEIRAAWPTFEADANGRKQVPLIVTIERNADRMVEGVVVPGYTNYTAKLANVAADVCPF